MNYYLSFCPSERYPLVKLLTIKKKVKKSKVISLQKAGKSPQLRSERKKEAEIPSKTERQPNMKSNFPTAN